MALKNLFGWNHAARAAHASACGSACGAGDPQPKPTEEPKPSACGSACGAGDPK